MLRTGLAAFALAALIAAPATAQDAERFYARVGPAVLQLDESATMTAGGAAVPGANVEIDDEWTGAVELGMFVSPNWAVSFTGGWPPEFEIQAAGSLAGLGQAGSITGGPASLTAHYHFNRAGKFQPYVGGGVAFIYIFDENDGALTNLKVDNTVGFAVQAGADYMITPRTGVFLDVKKAWLETEATGNLGPAPVVADVTLDPLVFHGGVTFRF